MEQQEAIRLITKILLERERRFPIRIEASARHLHLNSAALALLFGPEATLGVERELSQPGEFLSDKRVKLVTPKGEIEKVAVLGPLREQVQVELSRTDCRRLGIPAPLNLSGDLTNAGRVCLVGDQGVLDARQSVIVARSHLHLRPGDAAEAGLCDGQAVEVRVESSRPLTFGNVLVRVRENYAPAFHIDFDEANACALDADSRAFIIVNSNQAAPIAAACPEAACVPACSPSAPCFNGRVVTEATAKALVAGDGAEIFLSPSSIVTPSAADVFRHSGKRLLRR